MQQWQDCLLTQGWTSHIFGLFYCRDLDPDPMTFISHYELDTTKMYQYVKREVCRSRSRFIARRVVTDILFLLMSDLDPTLIYEPKNSVKEAYPHTQNELSRSTISLVIVQKNRQTDAPNYISCRYVSGEKYISNLQCKIPISLDITDVQAATV